MFAYRGEELFPSGEGGQILVFRQQHNGVWVACFDARGYQHRFLDAVIAQNLTLALSFFSYAHPLVVQVAYGQAELFGSYLKKFHGPNRPFRDCRALSISTNNDEKRAKKETREYAALHVCTSCVFRRTQTAKSNPSKNEAKCVARSR